MMWWLFFFRFAECEHQILYYLLSFFSPPNNIHTRTFAIPHTRDITLIFHAYFFFHLKKLKQRWHHRASHQTSSYNTHTVPIEPDYYESFVSSSLLRFFADFFQFLFHFHLPLFIVRLVFVCRYMFNFGSFSPFTIYGRVYSN